MEVTKETITEKTTTYRIPRKYFDAILRKKDYECFLEFKGYMKRDFEITIPKFVGGLGNVQQALSFVTFKDAGKTGKCSQHIRVEFL